MWSKHLTFCWLLGYSLFLFSYLYITLSIVQCCSLREDMTQGKISNTTSLKIITGPTRVQHESKRLTKIWHHSVFKLYILLLLYHRKYPTSTFSLHLYRSFIKDCFLNQPQFQFSSGKYSQTKLCCYIFQ